MEKIQMERLDQILSQCEKKEEYERLLREHQSLYAQWQAHINPLVDGCGLSHEQLAEGCGVSVRSVRSYLKKIPARREIVIMLAMMMKLSVEETNDLLMRWAKFQQLYSRNPNDAIWIYLLRKGGSDHPRDLFQSYKAEYERIREERLGAGRHSNGMPMDTEFFYGKIVDRAQQSVHQFRDEVDDGFRELMKENMNAFDQGYQKLLCYIDGFFYDAEARDNRRIRSGLPVAGSLFREGEDWKKAYYSKVRALEKRQTMPCRSFLITLGLRLEMNTDQINRLLDLAGMGPLCPKDKLDGSVVLYLEEICCHYPSDAGKAENISVSREYELMEKPIRGEEPRNWPGLKGRKSFTAQGLARGFEENSAECLNDYICRSIEGGFSEFGYEDYIMELAEQLRM